MWCGCVVLLVIGVAGLASTPYAWQRGDAMLGARTCTTEQVGAGRTDACFVPVPGRVTGPFSRGEWRFTPDAGRPDAYVRFAEDNPYDTSDWPPDLARLLGGERTTALYWGKDPVAFMVGARRVDTLAYGSSPVMVGLWGGVMGLSFGVASLRSLLHRRVGRTDLTLVVSGLVALVLLGVDVAGALSWRAEALWWGALVAGVLVAPSRWVRSWAALAERRRG